MSAPYEQPGTPLFDSLTGGRIVVRAFALEDADALYQAIVESRERMRPWLPWADQHQTIEETREFIGRARALWQAGGDVNGGIFARDGGRFLGGLGVHQRNPEVPSFEIGYWLRTGAEGHGYTLEGVALLVAHAAHQLGANRLVIRCDVRNQRSAAVAERSGFVREGTLRNDLRTPSGELRDTYVFALTPRDARWPGAQ